MVRWDKVFSEQIVRYIGMYQKVSRYIRRYQRKMAKEKPIIFTAKMQKKFSNALCGRPPDYKRWQDYEKEHDAQGVLNCWRKLAEEEEQHEKEGTSERRFWRVIVEIVDMAKDGQIL